jgi:signal transduction histidine kinase
MSEEVRQKAIDPFFTTKPLGQGTGLGLSMTFGYIRQSNGFLSIDSEIGRGTTVTILMPRHERAAAETQVTAAQ